MIFKLLLASQAYAQIWVPVPPANPVPSPYPGEDAVQMAINKVREENNLPLLLSTTELMCAANRHAKDLVIYRSCGHIGSDGSSFQERARDCGSEAHAELVACGYELPDSAVEAWLRDGISKRIILNPKNVAIGSSRVRNKWVILFKVDTNNVKNK